MSSRREFLRHSGLVVAASSVACAVCRPGTIARRRRDGVRAGSRRRRGRDQDVQGHSVRREHGGQRTGSCRRSNPAKWTGVRDALAYGLERAADASLARRRTRRHLAVAAAGLPRRKRRLPGAQRLDAGGERQPQAAGDVLVPRRRLRHRLGLVARSPTAPTSPAAATWWW